MRIARPILLVTTPLGVLLGLREAWRVRPALAVLMGLLIGVIALFVVYTWSVVRAERNAPGGPACRRR